MQSNEVNNNYKKWCVIVSPVIICILGNVIANHLAGYLQEWTWVPIALILWGTWSALVIWGTTKEERIIWFQKKRIAKRYIVSALIVGMIPLGTAIVAFQYLKIPYVFILWMLFAMINPIIEESYWRGLLITYTKKSNRWIRIFYTSLMYALSHPLIWGVTSHGNRSIVAIISIFIMGVVWGYIFDATNNLRYPVISHVMVDLFNMSVVIFLNLFIPPSF